MASQVKNNNKIKIILTVLTILVMAGVGWLFVHYAKATSDGCVTIIIESDQGEVLSTDDIYYKEGDTLIDLLEEKYKGTFKVKEGQYGAYITSIGDIEEKKEDNILYYISIYVNDEYANSGISTLSFKDKDVIKFKLEKYEYQ